VLGHAARYRQINVRSICGAFLRTSAEQREVSGCCYGVRPGNTYLGEEVATTHRAPHHEFEVVNRLVVLQTPDDFAPPPCSCSNDSYFDYLDGDDDDDGLPSLHDSGVWWGAADGQGHGQLASRFDPWWHGCRGIGSGSSRFPSHFGDAHFDPASAKQLGSPAGHFSSHEQSQPDVRVGPPPDEGSADTPRGLAHAQTGPLRLPPAGYAAGAAADAALQHRLPPGFASPVAMAAGSAPAVGSELTTAAVGCAGAFATPTRAGAGHNRSGVSLATRARARCDTHAARVPTARPYARAPRAPRAETGPPLSSCRDARCCPLCQPLIAAQTPDAAPGSGGGAVGGLVATAVGVALKDHGQTRLYDSSGLKPYGPFFPYLQERKLFRIALLFPPDQMPPELLAEPWLVELTPTTDPGWAPPPRTRPERCRTDARSQDAAEAMQAAPPPAEAEEVSPCLHALAMGRQVQIMASTQPVSAQGGGQRSGGRLLASEDSLLPSDRCCSSRPACLALRVPTHLPHVPRPSHVRAPSPTLSAQALLRELQGHRAWSCLSPSPNTR
jgi:hypothetical protein